MMADWLANVVAYSLQLAALIASTVGVLHLFPIVNVRWRLRVYQGVFAMAVLLPPLQLWLLQSGTTEPANPVSLILRADAVSTPGTPLHWIDLAVLVLGAGVCARVGRLMLGWAAAQRVVRRSIPLDQVADNYVRVADALPGTDVRLSNDVGSPATVGIWRAVVLVPPRFLTLSATAQRAVVLHELLHVRRRDWLRMIAEELWCALLWFHPLARVLVSRLDLAREMLVDRYVLDVTGNRRAYAEALLAFASDPSSSARTALPLIRPAHLSERVAAVVQEVPMSRRPTFLAVAVMCLAVLPSTATAIRLIPMDASTAPPLRALRSTAAQDAEVFKAEDGVTLPKPTYEQKPEYTRAAMDARIEGTALLAIVVQTDGTVGRVRVTKSLDTMYGLDEQAIAAARQWRFEPGRKDGKPVAVEVSLEFRFTLK